MTTPSAPAAVPFWRDLRVLRALGQVIFVVLVAMVAWRLYANMRDNLARQGLVTGYDFLGSRASFDIGEPPIPYTADDPYARALLVGAINTLRVAVVGIGLATVLGVLAGVARLSPNWLVRQLATAYVLIFRNTPLLLQLFFWYFAVIVQLPPVRQSVALPGSIFLNQRGYYMPWPTATPAFAGWLPWLIAAALSIVAWRFGLRWRQRQTDRPVAPVWSLGYVLLPLLIAALGWLATPSPPLVLSVPSLQGLNFRGGLRLSPELFALLVGLVVYTGAFIAEVVRAGIQAVSRGQVEAARALGLRPGPILRLVVFPQALRVVVPPLTNQYLNLAKNSSLAVAIGFPDLFSVSGTIINQTGKAVEMILIVMLSYLSLSLLTSLLMNIYNRRIALVER
jgi:general L-amino acid transport system permease protein